MGGLQGQIFLKRRSLRAPVFGSSEASRQAPVIFGDPLKSSGGVYPRQRIGRPGRGLPTENCSDLNIEWTHKRKNSHYISMIR
ncbi:hypothetical protein D1AOALGA4SA_4751 [Olavius algarvensis Delta 1 endosymbiont]|nr:hypothetical protein D1AOALGA4SA_4751 [Olavius algarvensis Delta 1 endosymbiont]